MLASDDPGGWSVVGLGHVTLDRVNDRCWLLERGHDPPNLCMSMMPSAPGSQPGPSWSSVRRPVGEDVGASVLTTCRALSPCR